MRNGGLERPLEESSDGCRIMGALGHTAKLISKNQVDVACRSALESL